MTIGDQADFVGRLKAVQPNGWYPLESATSGILTPVLTAIMTGVANSEALVYTLIEYVHSQTRISSATDVNLDIIALDYFGIKLQRLQGETDAAFVTRIKNNLLAPKNTVAAMNQALVQLTGNTPQIFEPGNPQDTGGWGTGDQLKWTGLAYGKAGGYGSLVLPFQAFIILARPVGQGVPFVSGYYETIGSLGVGVGGYGVGAIEYIDVEENPVNIPDSLIYSTIVATAPVATLMWVALTGGV